VEEPGGSISITVLYQSRTKIAGKNVVCVVSVINNGINRTTEIKERPFTAITIEVLFYNTFLIGGLDHCQFLEKVLDTNDDIIHFEYTKKGNRINCSAVV
jgi:threonine dehydratase